MGGDIAVAVAGVHPKARRVAAIVSTPDWTRPGMREVGDADRVVDQGEPTVTSNWLRERFEPLSNAVAFGDGHDVLFLNGADDTHVPTEAVHRFASVVNAACCRPVVAVEDAARVGSPRSGVRSWAPRPFRGLLEHRVEAEIVACIPAEWDGP